MQSFLASFPLRRVALNRPDNPLVAAARTAIIDAGDGTRLLGRHSAHRAPDRAAPPLVVLIHGWEGSADSSYVLSMASHLYRHGCDIFRLNLRDHGPSHHLNEGVFHACRLEEVVAGVAEAGRQFARGPLVLGGFSLGGNFALRVALAAPEAGLELRHVFAISPVLQPARVLGTLDAGPAVYRRYFLSKWRASLRRKQQLFPARYDFSETSRLASLQAMTEMFAPRYTPFEDADEYLSGYTLNPDRLRQLALPATVIAARDDPIIPVGDLERVGEIPLLERIITEHGGHCGFVESLWPFRVWTEPVIAHRIHRHTAAARPIEADSSAGVE